MTNTQGRVLTGFGWGVVATVAMSALMLIGMWTGMSPIPKPIPAAILGALGAGALPKSVMMGLAAIAHLAYGGLWGGLLTFMVRPVSLTAALLLGVGLWLVMQVLVLPFLGWGLFGVSVTPSIAGATLLLHLVYGAVLGAFVDRDIARGSTAAAEAEG